jgi:hypothetical protein
MEIQRHDFVRFYERKRQNCPDRVFDVPKHFGTVEHFKIHLTDDVLPPLSDRLLTQGNAP